MIGKLKIGILLAAMATCTLPAVAAPSPLEPSATFNDGRPPSCPFRPTNPLCKPPVG